MNFIHEALFEPLELEADTTESGRTYKLPDGIEFESITTALGKRPGKQEGLQRWRERVGIEEANKISTQASRRGTLVHEMLEKYVDNDKDYAKGVMPHILSLFKPVAKILDEKLHKVYMQECALYSKKYRLAGRVDCIGYFDGKLSVIDYKTSSKVKKRQYIEDYFLQCSGYSFMMKEIYNVDIEQIVVLIAVEGEAPQLFVDEPKNYESHEFFTQRLN